MGLLVWTELVCGSCATTSPGLYAANSIQRRKLMRMASSAGWVRDGEEAFCSTQCRDQWRADNEE